MDTQEDEWLLVTDRNGQEMLIHNPKFWRREKRFQEGYGEYWVVVRSPPRHVSEAFKRDLNKSASEGLEELF